MTEYIDREAAIKALCERSEPCFTESGEPTFKGDYIGAIASIPAADVRPVVLCRDCKHRDPEDHKCDCGEMERQGCPFPVDDDYYCAYGERKGGDE